ncbi:MAG: cation:proton antiporter, partial [Geminicoccaceae bacterium]
HAMIEHLNVVPIAFLLVGAIAGGLLLASLRQPPLVGYIFAGAVLGPSGIGLITDRETVNLLAELGVLVLLFVIGMHLSLRAFRNIWGTALGATALQIGISVSLMLLIGPLLDWSRGTAVLFGFVMALSSTVVGISMLEDVDELRSDAGRLAVGVLIAQDLAVVPMLIIVSGLASEAGIDIGRLLFELCAAITVLAALIWVLSRRHRMRLPFRPLLLRYPDLAPLAALTICVLGAALSSALELSPFLGAFLAGLYVGNTTERRLMVQATDPIRSLLLMAFFLSIGMLIDPTFVLRHFGTVLTLVGVVFLLNSVINVLALRAVGEQWRTAFIAGFALAQIGEFAFILSAVGESSGLITEQASRLIVAVIACSLVISPFWLELARRLHTLEGAPGERLMSLLTWLYQDEARQLRLRSREVAERSNVLAASLARRVNRVLDRSRRTQPKSRGLRHRRVKGVLFGRAGARR